MKNDTPHSLAFVPFRWMVEQTILCQTGILYEPGALHSIGFSTNPFIEARMNASRDVINTNAKNPLLMKPCDKANIVDPPVPTHDGEIETVLGGDGSAPGGIEEEVKNKKAEKEHQKQDKKEVKEQEKKAKEDRKEAEKEAKAKTSTNRISFSLMPKPKEKAPRHSDDTHVATPATPQRPELAPSPSGSTGNSDAPLEPPASVADESDKERQDHDLKSKIYDPLRLKPAWWLLEVIPMFHSWQDEKGKWHRTFRWAVRFRSCAALILIDAV